MLIFNYLIVYGSTIQENCEERSSKGRCGGKVLPAAGDTGRHIKAVKINFRPSSTVRPDIAATRAGQKIDFYDLEALVNKGDGEGGSSGGGSGSGDGGGSDGDQGENPLG